MGRPGCGTQRRAAASSSSRAAREPAEVTGGHVRRDRYRVDAALGAVHLAWAGPTGLGGPHYYRLQGPRLLIEYDNTQRHANHAHSVWRDPAADFGYDVLGAHLAAHHL